MSSLTAVPCAGLRKPQQHLGLAWQECPLLVMVRKALTRRVHPMERHVMTSPSGPSRRQVLVAAAAAATAP
ncbi:hypothetical protein, partial [Micromonospora zamorensis]|uniref:hypothetical protein n=1 Tax=Micromonospora zamorensis TaxID=709883 RepID=UPI0033A8E57E